MNDFKPSALFRNPHIQSLCASIGPRKLLVRRRARQLISNAETHLLDCGEGIQLQGKYNTRPENSKGLIIMIHGWLGSDESSYLLSAAQHLFQSGYNIFRLNLRDHGNTLHLNKELFNSTRLGEAVNAVEKIQQRFPHKNNYLCGFSLGGNFSLRIAARAPEKQIALKQVVAICPVINPYKTNRKLNDGLFIYHDYFNRKWRRALIKKQQYFPELNYTEQLKDLKTLDDMNDYFVPNHTDYERVDDYLNGYSITGNHLAKLTVPCHIISSRDDPVIEADHLQELATNENLSIELTEYGGHCGYIEGLSLNCWLDQRLVEIFGC
jgi:predicted alpha/beta-fold hydrolase